MRNPLQASRWNVGILAALLFVTIALPVLKFRMIRPAGDENVYVAQAFEMMLQNTWFLQTFGGDAYYYKGPLHYILLRFGIAVFGYSPLAAFYMNIGLVAIAMVCLAQILVRYTRERATAFGGALAFAFSIGLLPFTISSQMEAELTAGYVIALAAFLHIPKSKSWMFGFWLIVGGLSWIKSPLHSVLVGSSALLACAMTRQWEILLSRTFWVAAMSGVVLAVLGYGPIVYHDWESFAFTYLGRETFGKGPNGKPVTDGFLPVLTYYLFPWFFSLLLTLPILWRWRLLTSPRRRIISTCLAFALPTIIFFTVHPYRSAIYSLPALGPVLIIGFLNFSRSFHAWPTVHRVSLTFVGGIYALIPLTLGLIWIFMEGEPPWWSGSIQFAIAGWTAIGLCFLWSGVGEEKPAGFLTKGSIGFAVLTAALMWCMAVFGEAEVRDLRHQLRGHARPVAANLERHIWNDWGMLSLFLGQPLTAAYTEHDLLLAFDAEQPIVTRDEMQRREVEAVIRSRRPLVSFTFRPWFRWHSRQEGMTTWGVIETIINDGSFEAIQTPGFVLQKKTATRELTLSTP